EVFAKGIAWALRYDTQFTAADVALLKKSLARARERVAALESGKHSWTTRRGKVARAFVSAVDGSVQPYGLIVPANYDARKPMRLDVVLHGSTRPVGITELRFLSRFDEGDGVGAWSGDHAPTGGYHAPTGGDHAPTGGDHAPTGPPEQGFLELHP